MLQIIIVTSVYLAFGAGIGLAAALIRKSGSDKANAENEDVTLKTDAENDSAAEKAIKEVETRLREKFKELKPSVTVPTKVGDIIGALLTENGAFKFSDTSTASGKDYRRGVQALFEGTMAAYRNPSAHENLPFTKREAMEQIMLASQLMYILDKPQIPEYERMNDSKH